MSDSPATDMEVEEGSPMGGGECSDSPAHIMEPHVEIDEVDNHSLEPNVEIDEIEHHVVEPHVELDDGTEQNDGNVYPFDTLAVEYYEGGEDADSANTVYAEGASNEGFHETGVTVNGISHDSEETSTDVAIHDNSQCNSGSIDDTSLDADEITMDTSNSEALDSSLLKDDNGDPNYNEMQRTYLEDFFSSSASPSLDDSSNPAFERIPLSRFSTIVKVVERAEYETIQILYQLLYQRSAWDTQEILSKRVLEFSGFNFSKNSEEYYNREVMLQTLPNAMLVKIGAILCLDQVKNVLSNIGLGRHDLINAILEFLALPRKKSRTARFITDRSGSNENVEACGCRNNCLGKFTAKERECLATHHLTIREKKKQDAYFLNLIQVNRSVKKPGEDSKKHRDYKYNYKIKLGSKEIQVCKGGFMLLHCVKMSKLNQLQLKLKKGSFSKADLAAVVYPSPEGEPEPVPEPAPVVVEKNEESSEGPVSVEDSSESTSCKTDDAMVEDEDSLKAENEIKKKITEKVPAVVVQKIDPNNIRAEKEKEAEEKEKTDAFMKDAAAKEDSSIRKKLKEFPLVVKCMDEVSEELLIDLHFLLFLKSAESDKRKGNILEFDGFKFSSDSEEYDERNEFLQRMSGKLITDVARSFSLGIMSKREETIENILKFLMKPDESFLRTTASVPVILSDVELDDIDGMSDSDESITCEVVEKKVECIDLLSSGDESDKEEKRKKMAQVKTQNVATSQATVVSQAQSTSTTTSAPTPSANEKGSSSNVVRCLRDFETIRKIVNTHPPEYLVDIYELLFLKKHEPATLRKEILDFTGFSFEKGSPEYVKRKQVLDRMLYNNVRRVYNTLIHNSTEVKVFSKPTMINEIFQFLFKLPDHDTSVRPLPPGAKTLMPKQPMSSTTKLKSAPLTNSPSATPAAASHTTILPSQSGKLSDLKRVFQRVACFPCEYLVDVHKLLFMTDCDPKVIRQNIFGFKGFSFGVDSPDFQQRKMYLEYLTFHSLRKISSVLTTRSVDLRNSTKHELASHLTDVLAEYCNTLVETEAPPVAPAQESQTAKATPPTTTSSNVESVVTPVSETVQSSSSTSTTKSSSTSSSNSKSKSSSTPLGISIVETCSISSPAVTSSPSPAKGSRKRKSQTVRQMVSDKKVAPTPPQPAEFADINLPEVEQYRQIYGANLNVYPNVPTITGIASFGSHVSQSFPHLVPQAMTFPLVSPYPQSLGMQQPPQVLGLQSTAITMPTTNITLVNKPTELIVPAEIDNVPDETQNKSKGPSDIPNTGVSTKESSVSNKKENSSSKDAEEDGDKPLASLIGHPIDSVLEKHIRDIVENTDLQDITMNKIIKRIYDMYPQFDLSYRKEFIKSTLRTILYKLGEDKNQQGNKKENARDSSSPDCSVTTTDDRDGSLPASPENTIVS